MSLDVARSAAASRWRDRATRVGRFLEALWDQIVRDKLIIRASGLAYASLLAMVPLIAVVFALFTAFEAFEDLRQKVQGLLLNRFLPAGQEQVVDYIDTFIENSRDVGFLGFVMLIVTAVMLLDNIDWNFNDIWHVQGRRSLISRLTAYTSVLVFGTVLIGLSVSISARIKTALFTDAETELVFLSRLGSWLFPLASSFLAFLLMFRIIPATRVRVSSAVLGAAFSAVTWELGKNVFAAFVAGSVRYSTLYGSLAAIPIFLIWLYVTWFLVLVGLEIAYTHQNYSALVRRRRATGPTARERLALAVKIVALVARRFDAGAPPPGEDDLVEQYGIEGGVMSEIVGQLQGAGLIRRADAEADDEGLLPARSIDRIRAVDVMRAVWGARPSESPVEGELAPEAEEFLAKFEAGGRQALGELSLRDLLERADGG